MDDSFSDAIRMGTGTLSGDDGAFDHMLSVQAAV
jgi:hypothetical protein